MNQWKIEYDNETGPNDDGFLEWWIVTNGKDKLFKCYNKVNAKWLCDTLNKIP
jgi:hypothetical protein